MTRDELKQRVDMIIADGDSEAQHSMEDDLHLDLLHDFCPKWAWNEIQRLSAASFSRWTA